MATELELARKHRDAIERRIDAIRHRHAEAQAVARKAVNDASEAEIELQDINDRIRKLRS
jgi:hypothetical protein